MPLILRLGNIEIWYSDESGDGNPGLFVDWHGHRNETAAGSVSIVVDGHAVFGSALDLDKVDELESAKLREPGISADVSVSLNKNGLAMVSIELQSATTPVNLILNDGREPERFILVMKK